MGWYTGLNKTFIGEICTTTAVKKELYIGKLCIFKLKKIDNNSKTDKSKIFTPKNTYKLHC